MSDPTEGSVDEPFHAIRDVYRQMRYGKSTTTDPATPQAPGGTDPETGKQETVDEAVDRISGTASNAGKQSQSTDHQNSY